MSQESFLVVFGSCFSFKKLSGNITQSGELCVNCLAMFIKTSETGKNALKASEIIVETIK